MAGSAPPGRYLSAFGAVRAGAGGKTAAMLSRNRLLVQHLGVQASILTFDPSPDYPDVRAQLVARGDLVPGVELLNIFEWYRTAQLDPEIVRDASTARVPDELPDLGPGVATRTVQPDGGWPVTEHRDPTSDVVVARDYRRPDGSAYLRLPGRRGPGGPVLLVDAAGRPCGAWPHRRGWHRHWVHALAGHADRAFVFTDTDAARDQLWPLHDPRFTIIHVLHEIHVRMTGRELWAAPLQPSCSFLFEHLERLGALVTLTEQQRSDIVRRFGEDRTRIVALPNAVEPAAPASTPTARAAATFVMLARLTVVKRVEEAIETFALVVARHPEARLRIFGDGPLREELAARIAALDLGEHVELAGYDPRARHRLAEATGLLSTGSKETFGLGILEAMARGCPVLAYAVPYGPTSLVEDDVDGFLVADGDRAALAARIGSLIEAPSEVRRLSTAALEKAERYEPSRLAASWRALLDSLAG